MRLEKIEKEMARYIYRESPTQI